MEKRHQSSQTLIAAILIINGFGGLGIVESLKAEMAILNWDPNTESDLAGYRIYQRIPPSTNFQILFSGPPPLPSSPEYTVTGLQPGTTYNYIVTAFDQAGNEGPPSNEVSKTISNPPPPPGATLPFTANFTSGADGFVYTDDAFRGTSQPSYASGTHLASGGFSGGGLQVNLGGVDSADIVGMSGGWTRTFTLASPQPVTLSFRYNLSQTPEYEPGEISEALLMVDGTLLSIGGTQALAQLEGDGPGGATLTTDWVVVTHALGTLAAGTHTLTLGAFNSQKTQAEEATTLLIDEVSITGQATTFPLTVTVSGDGSVSSTPAGIICPAAACTMNVPEDTAVTLTPTATPGSGASFSHWSGACSGSGGCVVSMTAARSVTATFGSNPPPPPGATLPFTANFTSGADGFVYTDDAFRGTSQPSYASGTHLASGGFSGGGLQVNLGGVDSADIVGMSGGWTRTFTLASPQPVTLSFRYNLSQTPEYEPGEISEALLMVDGTLLSIGGTQALAQLEGDGPGGATLTTDWVVVTHALGTLAAGTHTLTLGAFNNQKTFADESTTLLIDEVSITGQATTFPLTVTVSGDGSVSSTPAGIICPAAACTMNVPEDTAVTLTPTATPGSGASFSHWSGACSGSGGCVVSMTAARSVTATFGSNPPPPPGATLPFTANFTSGADGFVYTDDAFRGTSQPSYASGTHLASGGFSGGGLQVNLGGVDSADIVGMSGGWTRTFTLASPQPVTLSFRYNLSQTPEYEPGEISEALLMVDGTLLSIGGTQALAQLEGDGPGGATLTTDWVVVTHALGTLAAGTHTLTLGAFNSQKTQAEESHHPAY